MSIDFADAVSKVKNVKLGFLPTRYGVETATRLVQNLQAQNNRVKTLKLEEWIDWRDLISSHRLKTVLKKMDGLKLEGHFTLAQVEAAKSVPGVEADEDMIVK